MRYRSRRPAFLRAGSLVLAVALVPALAAAQPAGEARPAAAEQPKRDPQVKPPIPQGQEPAEQSPTIVRASQLVKTLNWKAVDWDVLPMRDKCRALLFLTHAINKVDQESSARAELLSDYIDEKQWGPEFLETRGPDEPTAIAYADARRVCAAALKGPAADSRHASDLADVPEATLESYYTFYEKTAFRKWAEVAETRHLLRAASAFVHKKGAWAEYQTWSTAEAKRRQEEYDKEMASRRANAQAEAENRREAAVRAQAELQVAQNALQATTDFSSWNDGGGGGVDDDDSYAGWSYNDGWYWGATAWYRRPGYTGGARDHVEHHMDNWRGAGRGGGGGRIGGGRRR